MRYGNGIDVRTNPNALRVKFKLAKPSDLEVMLAIEQDSFIDPWSRKDFDFIVRQPSVVCILATHRFGFNLPVVCGYAVYRLTDSAMEVFNFAVAEQYRRRWVGTQMIEHLKSRIVNQDVLRIPVDEEDLATHLFLRSVGVKAVSCHKGVSMVEFVREQRSSAMKPGLQPGVKPGPLQPRPIKFEGAEEAPTQAESTAYLFEWRPGE